jgi:hypothetical protein
VKRAGPGVDLVGAQIEPGPDEDVPEALDRRRRLPMPPEKLAEGLGLAGFESGQPREQDGDPEPVANREVAIAKQRAGGRSRSSRAAALVNHGQLER